MKRKLLILMCAIASTGLSMPAAAQIVASEEAQKALLASDDPKLAANKHLVYDMYREVLQAGRYDLVDKYFTVEYIQHNPNVVSGRDALATFVKNSRPVREVEPKLGLPFVNIIAEGDYVTMLFERPRVDEEGEEYVTSWFDVFRIENGRIAEHWDPALKEKSMLDFDPNSTRR